jgi:hypothetical protein
LLVGRRGRVAGALLWPTVAAGLMAAIYTAFLFAQCNGQDLWQSRFLPAHLVAQWVSDITSHLAVHARGLAARAARPDRRFLLERLRLGKRRARLLGCSTSSFGRRTNRCLR